MQEGINAIHTKSYQKQPQADHNRQRREFRFPPLAQLENQSQEGSQVHACTAGTQR